jgi:hypothetical protein
VRVYGDRAGANDNVARLIGVSHWGGDGQGQQRSGEKRFAHDVLPESIGSYWLSAILGLRKNHLLIQLNRLACYLNL